MGDIYTVNTFALSTYWYVFIPSKSEKMQAFSFFYGVLVFGVFYGGLVFGVFYGVLG